MRSRLGAPKAITATAHKLAVRVYRMLKYGEDYVTQGEQQYEEQYRQRKLKALSRQAQELGYTLQETVQVG